MWGQSRRFAALMKLLPLSVVRQLCCSGRRSHASSDDSSAYAKILSCVVFRTIHGLQTVALQLPVVSYCVKLEVASRLSENVVSTFNCPVSSKGIEQAFFSNHALLKSAFFCMHIQEHEDVAPRPSWGQCASHTVLPMINCPPPPSIWIPARH